MRFSPAILVLGFLLFYLSCSNTKQNSVSHNTNSPPSASTPASQPTPNQYATSEATSANYLYQAKIYLQGKPSAYDLSEARKRLELIPQTAPEYKEAQSLLAQIKVRENRTTSEAILHVDYVDKIPVAVSQDAFYQIEDAISGNDDAMALIMIHKGRVIMIENNSPIVVLEPFGYLTKIKVKKSGRSGWVKSSWIRQEMW
ncbi:MAG TPA: tetratricopeptide repeat protein [Pyrinomonadaceae bacterium]|nr:tetratricopeptide repeat protein [Pyrinomonadaceae bacterium]